MQHLTVWFGREHRSGLVGHCRCLTAVLEPRPSLGKSLLHPPLLPSPWPALRPTTSPLLIATVLTFHCFLPSPVSSILNLGAGAMIFLEHRLGPVNPCLKPFKLLMVFGIRANTVSLHRRPSPGERSCLPLHPLFVPLGIGTGHPSACRNLCSDGFKPSLKLQTGFKPSCFQTQFLFPQGPSPRPFPWKPG